MDIRTMCLGVLSLGDATGYELKKLFEEGHLSHFMDASFGSIYPALDRLAREGLVRCHAPQPGGRAGRKVYAITEAGRQALRLSLRGKPQPDRFRSEFLFQLLFVDQMSADHVRRLIDVQLDRLESELSAIEAEICPDQSGPGARFVRDYARAMCDASRQFLLQHRASLERAAVATETTEAAE